MAKILVVDDEERMVAALKVALEHAGHTVQTSRNGKDAICRLADKPDLVLLDMKMPGGGGQIVLDSLGPAPPPIIIMTGSDMSRSDFQGTSVVRVLNKQFDFDEMFEAVNDVLNIRLAATPTSPAEPPAEVATAKQDRTTPDTKVLSSDPSTGVSIAVVAEGAAELFDKAAVLKEQSAEVADRMEAVENKASDTAEAVKKLTEEMTEERGKP